MTIERQQTFSEEVAKAISQGLGMLLVIGALPFLVSRAPWQQPATNLVAASMFAGSMATRTVDTGAHVHDER